MRIKQLSPELASQIAAGEVIERPASILKELLENSIDAGAKKIDIYITRGGVEQILVRDNGHGIEKHDLELSILQHATSKIFSIEDLFNIRTLGFRGEALASINSVAKLKITSNTCESAWTLVNNKIEPDSHPVGTSVCVTDLFYNVPARRKFLRRERTEFMHLEEIFKRIALSNFDVSLSLYNNGKIYKKLPKCIDDGAKLMRIVKLCGKSDLLTIESEQNSMKLLGWVGLRNSQYFFINNRNIRDRLVNHAIREVSEELGYCLYLQLDPKEVDVNVHPTKHEVRFENSRIIHAFIQDSLREILGQKKSVSVPSSYYSNQTIQSKSSILGIIAQRIILVKTEQGLTLVDGLELQRQTVIHNLQNSKNTKQLTMFKNMKINDPKVTYLLENLGFEYTNSGPDMILIRAVPEAISEFDFDASQLFLNLKNSTKCDKDLYLTIADTLNYKSITCTNIAEQVLLQAPDSSNWYKELDTKELINMISCH